MSKTDEHNKRKSQIRLYINVACDILDIPTPFIHYRIPQDFVSRIATTIRKGEYYHIYLNAEYEDDVILFDGCLHECRHVYQQMVCDSPLAYDIEPKELVDSWRKNLESYQGNTVKDYELQPLEIDAYAFGDYVFNTMYGKEVIPRIEPLRTPMLKRIEELKKDYPEEFIMEVAKDYFKVE